MSKRNKLNDNKIYKSNAGFTLVELMVVIVMLVIVAGLTVFGILKWQDWSRFNQENEYAQTLFVAAQNQLSEYAANGRLEELQASLAGLDEGDSIYDLDIQPGDQIYCPLPSYGLNLTSNIGSIVGEDGNAYDLDKVFPESNDKDVAEKYRDEIVSLRAEAGEYSAYLAEPTQYKEINPEAFWVFELLGAYVYDTSILDGGDQGSTAICVEITPRDGQVFAVLYSDRNTKFIYKTLADANGSEEESFVSDISNRTESYRRPRMVGYYGVDTLYASTVNATIRPSISRVKLHNEDTFYLTAKLSSKYKSLTQRMTYEIDLDSSKDVTAKKLSLILDGTKLKNEGFADTIMCPVNRYDETGKKVELGEMPILAWIEKDSSIHVVYDAADIQATTYLYENELEIIRNDAATEEDKEDTSFWGTLSFFRFGIDLDNVYATIVAKAAGYVDSRPASNFGNVNPAKNQPGGKNPVFASIKKENAAEGTSYAYGVGNARHLYNIRYVEDLSYEDEAKGYKNVTAVTGSRFTLNDDIDFGKFQADGYLYDSYEYFAAGTVPKDFKDYWNEYSTLIEGEEFENALNARIVSLSNIEINRKNPYRYECEFPSYKVLRENDTFDGNNKTVLGIRISEISNKYLYDIYSVKEDNKKNVKAEDEISVGLFDVCEGTYKDFKLDDFAVRGTNRVGAFCGLNRGSVDNLETLNTHRKSQVVGHKNVGGIMGSQPMLATTNEIKNLTNRAAVYGTEAVGGIVGQVRNEENGNKGTVLIDECNNKGPVTGELADKLVGVLASGQEKKSRATIDESEKEKTRYIGGIVGYCYNSNTGDARDITVRNCVSSLQYTSNELSAILSDPQKLNERLVGDYVGGIVGYNYYGTILNCSAQADKGVEGCIFGYKYVGGIVGFNIGPASGIEGSNILGGKGVNANNVVGCYYVGGITGANACAKNTVTAEDGAIITLESNDPEFLSENDYILETDPEVSLDIKVDNWTNKGVVIATKEYAGGITGFNSGWIYRCQSEVNFTAVDNYFNALMSIADLGNYAGGIAGYNNGIIGNTDRNQSDGSKKDGATGSTLSVNVYVNGHNYVGGVVGYNDVDAIVEDYQVSGGYVRGYDNKFAKEGEEPGKEADKEKSSFVGGYVGFNAAIDLLMDLEGEEKVARFIRSNPNKVEGTYFVGGTIGGNIINTFGFDDGTNIPQKGTKNVLAQYKTDNFLGTLKGDEFVGGYIGYNIFIDNDDKEDWVTAYENGDRNAIYVLQSKIIDKFNDIEKVEENGNDITLLSNKNILDDLNNSLGIALKESDGTITISGKEAESARTEFGSIEAKIYVGGVLGYNDAKTNLLITDVVNATPVIATQAVKYKEEQPLVNWLGEELRDEDGKLLTRNTDYIGKEFEYEYSYAGGIIGKVGRLTIIDDCHNSFSGTVKTEGTYTGGLCEVNEGEIRNCETSNLGNGVDNYLGGLCGLNKFDGQIHDCTLSKKTINGGNVVGGIVAENFGIIKSIAIEEPRINAYGSAEDSKDGVAGVLAAVNGDKGRIELEKNLNNIVVKSGGRYVGAVAGINEGAIENKKTAKDNAELLGELGIDDNLEISGSIEGYYDVGALIGLNKDRDESHIVNNYTNKATVIASNGNAGGIIGENASNNTISFCVNDAVVSATIGNAGGITSVNYGIINNSFDYKSVSAPKGMCGGIVAYNGDINNSDALIEDCYVGGPSEVIFVSTGAVGGVAARNYGIIQRNELENVTATNIGTIPHTSIGGVVGDNAITGRIYVNNRTVDGKVIPGVKGCKVIATTNNCNVGGVAGTNDGLITKADNESGYAIIGTEISLDGADYASMGGVTGLNTGTVSYCQVDAVINGYLGTETTGYGGIAGFNGYSSKELYNTGKQNHSKDSNYRAQIINCTFDGNMRADGSAGNPANVGGMTGVNGYGGFISGCAIGVRDKDINGIEDETTTQILSGDFEKYAIGAKDEKTNAIKNASDIDKNAYAYVGGIAGRNYAYITDIDMQSKYLDENITMDTIVVKSFGGSTGGMVGFQYEDASICGYKDNNGEIHWVSSPETMSVEMMFCENDYGVGGIIGYDKSGNDKEYLRNNAHVSNFVNMNVKTGGIIGTIEQQKIGIVKISNCENYGKVEGLKQVGGLIGRTKYCSVNMEDCINYGEVYATNGTVGGLISRIYDVHDTYVYMTHCINYGYVHAKGSENVGGLLGNLDSSTNITAYIYDCDNVGVVEKDQSSKYVDGPIPYTTTQTTVGDFVGSGTNGLWYMEQCQNYNHSISSNGFIGNGGKVKIKDSLDDSNNITNSNRLSPFLGTGVSSTSVNLTNSTLQNAYYLDETSKNENTRLAKDGGAYFSYQRYTTDENLWNGYNFQVLNNPGLYLQVPSEHTFIKWKNGKKVQFQIAYDYGKCSGINAFNIYFCNGKMDNTANITTKYTITAVFSDKNGKTEQVTETKQGVTNVFADNKVSLEVPSGLDKDIRGITISISGADAYLHGFSYNESVTDKEYACSYISEKSDTTFHIAELDKDGTKDTQPAEVSGMSKTTYLDEYLGIRALAYEWMKFTKKDAKGKYKITIDVNNGDEASGMNAFVFYPCNNNKSSSTAATSIYKYYYDYEVVFVNKEGEMSSPVAGNAIGYDSSEKVYAPAIASVPDDFDNNITRVILTFGNIKREKTDKIEDAQKDIFLRGFAWIPTGSTEIEPMGIGDLPNECSRPGDFESFGSITKLYCDYSGNEGTQDAPYVYTEYDYNTGFNMTNNDPAADYYYADRQPYLVSNAEADGSDSRVNVYKDLHPKFTEFVQEQYLTERKLATPVPTVEDKNSMYKVTWAAIPGAYKYEVKCEVKSFSSDEILYSNIDTVGGGTTSYVMSSDNTEWVGCEITFSVKAVNAYRYSSSDEDPKKYAYDSEWGPANIFVKQVLPQPVVHLELTAGNRMVAILENREDYALANGSGYMDCVVETTFTSDDKITKDFKIEVADGFVSTEALYLSGNNISKDHNILARAVPADDTKDMYSESHEYHLRGRFVDNSSLNTISQYPDGVDKVDFRGFYGTEADKMTYSVYYTVDSSNARDGYVKADIIAFDEELGMNVSYSSMETHTAASSGSAYFTATLSDLPQEWFAEDFKNEIVVRSYLETSQYHHTHYGHPVAADVVLEGTAEEKLATLKDIKDPYYLVDDGNAIYQENVSILDEDNNLKPGYTLQIKYDADGNKIYDIFYNATIELAEKDAIDKPNYVYSNFAVGYKQYVSNKNAVEIDESGSTKLSISSNYADINKHDYQETFMTRNFKNGTLGEETWPATNTNLNVRMQEIQPAPIIDEDYVEELVDGHKSYTFTFDEYYKDVECMTKGGKANYYNKNEEAYITHADAEIAPTWAAFIQKSDFKNADTATKLRIMNAYYSTYSKAEYKVELLGTTLDGQEAVIEAKEVSGAMHIEGKDITPDSYTVGTTQINTVYERYNYRVTFTDTDNKWNDYSNFTIRVKRKGTKDNAIKANGVPDNSGDKNPASNSIQIGSYNNSTFVLPRYSDYKIRIMLKLNSINNPTVGMHQDAGHFVTDNLLYDVSFGTITDTAQLRDLGGYLITAKVITPSNPDDVAETHYYYVKEFDDSIEGNDIGIDKEFLEASGVLTEIDKESEYTIAGNVRKAIIDLSDFNTNDVLEISVKAIASTKAENYKDSDEGSVTQTQISERLVVPEISKIVLASDGMAESYTEAVDSTTYGKGYYVNYAGGTQDNLTIDFAAAIFDEQNDNGAGKVVSGDDATGTWNDQALSTIFAKKEPLSAQCKPTQVTVQIPLSQVEQYPGQFADKWIKIAAKAKSTSVIASKWTDEDVADASSNYKWIHIPKLKLDDVALTELVNTDSYAESIGDGNVLTHSTLEVTENKCVDGYRFTIVGNNIIKEDISSTEEGVGDTKKYTLPVYVIELSKHLAEGVFDGTMDIYIKDISYTKIGSEVSQASGIPTLLDDKLVIDPTSAPQVIDLSKVFTGEYEGITTSLMLRYVPSSDTNNTNGKIQLILPDISHVGETQVDNFITSQVFVEEYVDDADGAYVAPANASMWGRTASGTEIVSKDISAENYFDYLKERLSNE